MRRGTLVLLGVLLLGPRVAAAQVRDSLAPARAERRIVVPRGARVRLRTAAESWHEGRLVAPLAPTSTLVQYCPLGAAPCPGPDAAAVRQQAITSELQLAVWRGGHTAHGALVGGLVTAGVLALGILAWHDADAPRRWDAPRVIGLTAVVGLGTGLGALIGHHAGRWTPLTLGHTGP